MKKRYQIDQQRAVQEFRQLARQENPHLQMIFPMTEVVGLLQEGVGHLHRPRSYLWGMEAGARPALHGWSRVAR
jgi:hypothetical protein